MKTTIGPFDPAKGTVSVRFEVGSLVHDRRVKAVLKADGKPDRKATAARVAEVATGVAHKFKIGALRAQPEEGN